MGVHIGIEASHRLWTLQSQALCTDTDNIYFAKNFLIEFPRSKYPLHSKRYSALGWSAVKSVLLFILPHCKRSEVHVKKIPMVLLSQLIMALSITSKEVCFSFMITHHSCYTILISISWQASSFQPQGSCLLCLLCIPFWRFT